MWMLCTSQAACEPNFEPAEQALRGQHSQGPMADLLVDVADGLLALAVHVQDLQEGLVHALVRRKAGLGPARRPSQQPPSVTGPAASVPAAVAPAPSPGRAGAEAGPGTSTAPVRNRGSDRAWRGRACSHLDFVDVVDRLVELHRLLGLGVQDQSQHRPDRVGRPGPASSGHTAQIAIPNAPAAGTHPHTLIRAQSRPSGAPPSPPPAASVSRSPAGTAGAL